MHGRPSLEFGAGIFMNSVEIVQEVASSLQTERGNRLDSKHSVTIMEDRNRQG